MKTITEEEFMKDIGHGVERTQENWKEEFDKRFELLSQGCSECGGDYLVDLAVPKESGYFCEYDLHKIKDFISTLLAEERNKVLSEERQFILNILDGIDIADKEMGLTGGTQAIRQALQSRI